MVTTPYVFLDFIDMMAGIDTVSSAMLLKQKDCRDSQDVDYFPIGGFSKRNGYTKLDTASPDTNAVTGLYMGRYATGGGTNIAYRVSGTKLYSMTSGLGGTWTDITSGLTITTGQNNVWCFDILNNLVILANGTDTPIQISSTPTASALAGAPPFSTCLFPVQTRGYMWFFVPTVGGNIKYDRGYFSNINDPNTVGANNFVDIGIGQGGDIKGAIEYKTYFFVWKRHGIYQLIYQPTQVDSNGNTFPWVQNPNPVVPGVGAQSHRSITKFTTPTTHATPGQELVFFIDQFGVPRIFDGSTTISFSSKIGSSRDTTITSLSNMDTSRTKYSFSINYPSKNKILSFLSKANSQQDTCWVMDYSRGFSIGRYKYASAFNTGYLFEKSDGTFKPYVGTYDGQVMELDKGSTDNGGAIYDYYMTGDSYIKSPVMNSKWYFFEGRGQNGSSSQNTILSYYINGGDTPEIQNTKSFSISGQTQWGAGPPAMIWGQSSWAKAGLATVTDEINLVGKTLRVKVESSNKLSDSLIMEGFSLAAEPLGTAQSAS